MPPLILFTRKMPSPGGAQGARLLTTSVLAGLAVVLGMAGVSMLVAGCGSSSATSAAKATPIIIVGSSGAAEKDSVVVLASALNLSMSPSGDKLNAGVDWTVNCGGNPITGSVVNGGCGTLAPAHTADGATTVYTAPSLVPVGAAVTFTATVTSNPSQSSSMTLTVIPLPIGVNVSTASGSLPTSLEVNAQTHLIDTVTNDPLGAGVIWTATCGSSACGSFNPTVSPTASGNTAYTAPSAVPTGGAVTITATSLTDTSKSFSLTLSITPPPAGIAVSLSPAATYVQTTGTAHLAQFTAFVTGDTNAAGVDWSLSCGVSNCGGVSPRHTASGVATTYSAPSTSPPSGTITITAISTTDPTISASATATVVTASPIAVTLAAPPPATLVTGAQATLVATVASDPGNNPVNWTATCGSAGACGSFNLSPAQTSSGGLIVYTAPAAVPTGAMVTITAASAATTPSNPGIAFTTIVAQPPSVSITRQPAATLVAATQTPVIATVANDVTPGGVTWSVTCNNTTVAGSCGWIAPLQTASGATAIYTAPPAQTAGTTVTLTATSTANPNSLVVSNAIAITPNTTPSVSFVPLLPAQVPENATVNLNAAVANDTTNAGVDWQVCASGCGFFTVKPAVPAIAATSTTPYVPAVPAVTATSVSAWSNGLTIPYTAPAEQPASGPVTVAASAHADATKSVSGTIAITTGGAGPALNGLVLAGAQPVVGASVALYAAGTSGYASAASEIASTGTGTGKTGSFTIPAGYACPSASSQMYLVATGGAVGSDTANPELALMAVLGSCGSLGSTPIVINEVTTVASVFATAPFTSNDELTGNKSYLYLGAGSGNATGLANAFAAVNNLVNIATGQANFVTPTGNAVVPYAEINTLADALNACTATSGGVEGDGSGCGNLFTATDVVTPTNHALYNAIAPTDTLQAAFNIAQHPVTNYGYTLTPAQLFALVTPSAPFQPVLTASPNDWSISMNYTGGGGLGSAGTVGSFAVDSSGNLWITDTAAGSAIEWNAVGAALSPATGFPAGGGPMAIDANGNVWISGPGKLHELTSLGTPAPGSPFAGVPDGGTDMAIDALGNLWIADGAGVSEFSSLGVALSPAGGFLNGGVFDVTAVSVDSADNVWLGQQGDFAELANPGGVLIVEATAPPDVVLPEIAADGAGNLWGIDSPSGYVYKVSPYGGAGSTFLPTSYAPDAAGGSPLLTENSGGLAFDGAGTVWVASQGGGTSPVILPSVLPIAPSLLSSSFPTYLASPSLAAGTLRVAIDGSGNIWVLLANNRVTEYVGAATPVVAPVALGLQNKKLAAKP